MNKMFSKMLLLLSFLINIFNSTFCIPQELVTLIGGIHPQSKEYNTNIRNISVNLWAGLCEYSFQYLRSSKSEYSNLYVNYTLFNNSSPKCDSVTMGLPHGKKMCRPALHCYGRPSVVQYNVLPVHYNHCIEIVLIPVVNIPSSVLPNKIINKVYIFKRKQDTGIYILIAEPDLGDLRLTPNILFERLPPVIEKTYIIDETVPISAKQMIPNWKKSETNVLNTIGLNEFVKLCVWMLGQESFKSEFIVTSKSDDYGGQKSVKKTFLDIKVSDIDGLVFTDVYICKGTYMGLTIITETEPGNGQYALAVTDMVDKVIVCKSINKTINIFGAKYPIFHALQLVNNVNEEYLKEAP